MLLSVLVLLLTTLTAPFVIYYVWMRGKALKAWDLVTDSDYKPKVSLIIATYNEASIIRSKLEDVQTIEYPPDKLQVILVDSASNDGTLDVCKNFAERSTLRFPIRLLSEKERLGKSHALNTALEYAEGEIIATSDADSFWEPDALRKAVSFFADLSVGAVTGREKLINLEKSVHTLSEGIYRKFYYTLRLGESKMHSTLIFQGELSLFRRSAFGKFEERAGYSDDTGTVISIVSRGFRCIFTPEAVFYDTTAFSLSGRLMLKSRRAQHLVAGIVQALRFKIGGSFPLSSVVVFFNFYMHVMSPLLLVSTAIIGVLTVILHPQILLYLIPLIVLLLTYSKLRLFMISYLTSNLALITGLLLHFTRKRGTTWRKIEEM
jgi:cellulose synthase/poly-beta-1,6-N-acetylglucosamine synthase-like glycosyltransferase